MLVTSVRGFPGGSVVKNPLPTQEMQVQSLGQEDSLEKEMATYPAFLPGEFHGQRGPGGLWSIGSQRAGHD